MEEKVRERELSKAVIQLLQYEENKGNLYFIRNNSYAGYLSHSRNAPGHYTRQGKKGCADLIVFFPKILPSKVGFNCSDGIAQFWELKGNGGKQSPEQKEFEIKIGLLGFRYYLITELSQAERLINEKGVA